MADDSTSSSSSEVVTTTTTTQPPALKVVRTVFFEQDENGNLIQVDPSDASDNNETVNTPFSESANFGVIAPGGTSGVVVVQLSIPFSKAITNVKLALINSGGITFANNIFGITSSVELRSDITPSSYFQGINTNNSPSNSYNISIPNNIQDTSDYVYLNISLPRGNSLGEGVTRFRWYFDYSD